MIIDYRLRSCEFKFDPSQDDKGELKVLSTLKRILKYKYPLVKDHETFQYWQPAMITEDDLNHLAETIQVSRLGPSIIEPGQPVAVKLVPPTHELTIIDNSSLGIPISIPVLVEVAWIILKEDGQTKLTPDEEENEVIRLDHGDAPSEAIFLFLPQIVELTSDQASPAPVKRFISAEVTLKARVFETGTIPVTLPFNVKFKVGDLPPLSVVRDITVPTTLPTSFPIKLPTALPIDLDATTTNPKDIIPLIIPSIENIRLRIPLQINLQPLPIPTILALFMHQDFAAYNLEQGPGAVLIVTPANSVFKKFEDVQLYLNKLEPIINNLTFIGQFALFLLGLRTLANALSSQPGARFISVNKIGNLNKIKLIDVDKPFRVDRVPLPGTDVGNDFEGEDVFSSLILIAPPRARISPDIRTRMSAPISSLSREEGTDREPRTPPEREPLPPASAPPLEPLTPILGQPVVKCYIDRHFAPEGGQMNIHIGVEMCVLIPDLHRIHSPIDADNASIPTNRIEVKKNAPGPSTNSIPTVGGSTGDILRETADALQKAGQNLGGLDGGYLERAGNSLEDMITHVLSSDGFGNRMSSLEFKFENDMWNNRRRIP